MEDNVRLQDGETILATSKIHIVALLVPILTLIVGVVIRITFDPAADLWQFAALVLIVLGLWRTVDAIGTRRTTKIVLTNRRLIASTGPFRIKKMEVLVGHVDRVVVRRGLVARLFNYGTIIITARGDGNQRIVYRQIADPATLAKTIHQKAFAISSTIKVAAES